MQNSILEKISRKNLYLKTGKEKVLVKLSDANGINVMVAITGKKVMQFLKKKKEAKKKKYINILYIIYKNNIP